MKSRLLKLGVFLLLGAIVNVAVAWGCSLFRPATPREASAGFLASSSAEKGGWDVYTEYAWGGATLTGYPRAGKSMQPQTWNEAKLFPPRLDWQTELQEIAPKSPESGQGVRLSGFQILDARGWPMLALQARFDENNKLREPKHRWRWGIAYAGDVTQIPNGVRYDNLKALPLRPIWPGFAINTILFAAILWLLFVGWRVPGKIRRFVRIRGHRCPACGFIIAPDTCANGLCSECGHKLPWIQTPNSQNAETPT